MPTYEYLCDACEHQFEKFQSMKDDPIRTCPDCKRKKLRRLIGFGAGILFKGSGFYQTDYRSKGYQDAVKKDKGTSSSSKECGKSSCQSSAQTNSSPK